MPYDSPKAAHFTVTDQSGREHLALVFRWRVASIVADEFPDLLDMSDAEWGRVDEICAECSTDDFTVKLTAWKAR